MSYATVDVLLMRQREDDGSVSRLSGDDVIATAMPAAVQAQAPPAPTVEEAEIATRRGRGLTDHRFPTCFVCGTARDDGLRIYPVASGTARSSPPPWTPESRRSAACVGSARLPKRVGDRVCRPPRSDRCPRLAYPSSSVSGRAPGERHVVAAWPVGSDGRKHHSASALYDATGRVLAVADALWIGPRDPAAFGG